MHLNTVVMMGCHVHAGEFTRVMTWLPNSQELVFAAGSVIVVMQSGFQAEPDQAMGLLPVCHACT